MKNPRGNYTDNLSSWEIKKKIKDIIWNWEISEKLKIMSYKAHYLPIWTYTAETWTWTKRDVSRLQAVETKFI
jgi:hypothetical protein